MDITLPVNRQILFVDMNSFFASCEQAENPALQSKPVIVVPTKGSCALSASYEAKAFGIKTGTLEKEARFLCPNLIAVLARPKLYMEYHYKFECILNKLAPRVTMRSVDEASIRLCRNEDPHQLGQAIKARIWRELGTAVSCSVGIGPNIFLAKLATELQKPDGLVEIRLNNLPNIYRNVHLRDLCGINYAMERRLNGLGIYTVVDFYHTSASILRQKFGIIGYRWWLQLRGYPSFEHEPLRRSFSHSHVLPPMYRAPQEAYVTLNRLTAKVGRRLRKAGYTTARIALYLRLIDRTAIGLGCRIRPAADTLTLCSHSHRLWTQLNPQAPIIKIALWVTDLEPLQALPLPLFPEEQKRLSLARALDTINDRYGANTVRFSIIDTTGSKAPDRISFTALFPIEHE